MLTRHGWVGWPALGFVTSFIFFLRSLLSRSQWDKKITGFISVYTHIYIYNMHIYIYIYVIKASCEGTMWRLTLFSWQMTFPLLMDKVGELCLSIWLFMRYCQKTYKPKWCALVCSYSLPRESPRESLQRVGFSPLRTTFFARVHLALFLLFSLKTSYWRCCHEHLARLPSVNRHMLTLSFLSSAPDGTVKFLFLDLAVIATWIHES